MEHKTKVLSIDSIENGYIDSIENNCAKIDELSDLSNEIRKNILSQDETIDKLFSIFSREMQSTIHKIEEVESSISLTNMKVDKVDMDASKANSDICRLTKTISNISESLRTSIDVIDDMMESQTKFNESIIDSLEDIVKDSDELQNRFIKDLIKFRKSIYFFGVFVTLEAILIIGFIINIFM